MNYGPGSYTFDLRGAHVSGTIDRWSFGTQSNQNRDLVFAGSQFQAGSNPAPHFSGNNSTNSTDRIIVHMSHNNTTATTLDMSRWTFSGWNAGGSQNDRIIVYGSSSTDRITGTSQTDFLRGEGGSDYLYGGAGNDTLFGGSGSDRLYGGSGNDTLDGGDLGDHLHGDSGNDILWGGAGFDYLYGGAGNDVLYGGSDADMLYGGDGADTLIGGPGADRMEGGAGDDVYETDGLDTLTEFAGGGYDLVITTATLTLGANFEALFLGGTGNISGTGNELGNLIQGNAGNNTLNGGAGDDTLFGGAGNDRLIGGAGADRLEGGSGNDTYEIDANDTLVELASGGTDTVRSPITHTLGAHFENLVLTGTASINGTGNSLANTITGNAVNNTLSGAGGNDILNGGAGNDRLNGGSGSDTLTGGSGADQFVFNSALGPTNVDRITDFNVIDDTIRLDDAVFTALAPGTLAANAFVSNASGNATSASHRIIYEFDTGFLFYDSDGSGSGAKVHFATLNANLSLTQNDFVVF